MSSSSGKRRFLSTAWSLIQEAAGGDGIERERAWERLADLYWRPVYWTIRIDWNEAPEDARDLTQDFFSLLFEKRLLHAADPERGRFRAYVKGTIRNFMLSRKRSGRAGRRGGGRRILALDDLERVEAAGPARIPSPRAAFERELMTAIIDQALRALEDRCRREGRIDHYRLFRTFYMEGGPGGTPSYADLRERFDLTAHEVKNRLAAMRLAFRRLVLEALRDGITSESDLIGELREVFGS